MFGKEKIEALLELLYTLDEKSTKIYIGTDSTRFRKEGDWHAKYATVVVVHMNGNKGCKIFREIISERVYDVKASRPSMRLMREVQLTCEAYNELAPFIDCYDVEIHVDVNLNEKHGSNCVAKEASGYILGMTGMEAKFKPNAPCASFAADYYAS